ncbi:NAD-dependent epimerase [Flagellimonas sp.]|uniref:NAD-dependent epimerase n=1 Tax=Flagellimonas sp. TaxID=2058762 RepID=UPI003B50F394
MKILITGAAGFIGYHLCKKLLENDHEVIGVDNINDYCDVNLKHARLKDLGVYAKKNVKPSDFWQSDTYPSFKFVKLSIEDREGLPKLFKQENIDVVCNLAAQAGVRYSLENPEAYVDSNIVGFLNILECCRNHSVKHLVYASSSSVYGLNREIPFNVSQSVDHPVSLYAASKKSNELMAHTYSHLYGFRTTGLRFFTVYGPWGRPDMAMFLFTKAIIENKPIDVFNNGDLERDFTYITDIIEGVERIIEDRYTNTYNTKKLYHLYNIGNSKSVKLLDFIENIEENLGLKANKIMKPMQPGDVKKTWADVTNLQKDYNYCPNTPVNEGIKQFVKWYRSFYKL